MKKYSLGEIREALERGCFPFCGTTTLGSARFIFKRPAVYAGFALHAGNRVREELLPALAVATDDRLREEDPGTEVFIEDFPLQLIALDSRFEYDLNRPVDRAIPLTPDMAWGLTVWKRPLTAEERALSLAKHEEFHRLADLVCDYLTARSGRSYVFDIHSYCYQRESRRPWQDDPKPVVNLGTEAVNRGFFGRDIDDLLGMLEKIRIEGKPISVAENEIFRGGYLSRRLASAHNDRLCVFAIEFKKVFMDEWTGEFYGPVFKALVEQFRSTASRFIEGRC